MINGIAGERHRREVAALYAATREGLIRYLMAFGLKAGAAEDTAQDAFLRLYTELRDGKEILQPRVWVYRVAHNLAINAAKRDGARSADPHAMESAASRESSAEEQLIEQEWMEGFREAVNHLSDRQRVCLELRSQGLRFREIAEVLEIEISTAAEFVRRGIEELKRWNKCRS